MRLECGGGVTTSASGDQGGSVVVVGVKLDTRSRELLTWALVKIAQTGDRVIALNVLDPNADKSSLLSLVKTFDSVLAAYEGFCNLKQIDLKLEVCRGSPIHKILLREAKSCGATTLITGASEIHHKIRSKISVAKYCAKNLPKNVSVICVENGKILFQREPISSIASDSGNIEVLKSRFKTRKALPKCPLSLPAPGHENQSSPMALVPIKTQEIVTCKPGWSVIRRVFLPGQRVSETSAIKKPPVMQRILRLPTQQSVASICPDQKQNGVSDTRLDFHQEEGVSVQCSVDTTSIHYCSKKLLEELKGLEEKYSTTCQSFSYEELLLATNSFAPENFIGKGGSSKVYRGCLPVGKELAVKVLNPSAEVLKHFVSEIEIITSLHHKNLISLVGFCIEEDRLLLVYNLLSRGSLEENLHGTQRSENTFGWGERHKVALGVAEALDHLHNSTEVIIHRDVKSSNILLSDDFEPQLSDFGLATLASHSSHHIDTSDVAGTFGYLAPEYFLHGKLNPKIDVYAYGIVLLELLSGRKPIDDTQPKGKESLVMWAEHILREGKISELQDPDLGAFNHEQFQNMVLAATLCIRHAPQSRPEISIISKLIQGNQEVIELVREESNKFEEGKTLSGEASSANIQSFINLALCDVEDDCASVSSNEQNISVEDYLKGRWSRSSSFD